MFCSLTQNWAYSFTLDHRTSPAKNVVECPFPDLPPGLVNLLINGILLTSYVANQKARKAIDNVGVILNKIHLSFFTASLWRLSPHLFPAFDHLGVLLLTSAFYVSILLLIINLS